MEQAEQVPHNDNINPPPFSQVRSITKKTIFIITAVLFLLSVTGTGAYYFIRKSTGSLTPIPQAPTPTIFHNTIAPSNPLPTEMVSPQSQQCNGNSDCPAGFVCEAKMYCPLGKDCYTRKSCRQNNQQSNDLLSCRTNDDCTLYNASNCCGWKPVAKNALNLVTNIPQTCAQECNKGTPKCSSGQCILSK